MKSTLITLVFACLVLCLPLPADAEGADPEGDKLVQPRSETQSQNMDEQNGAPQTTLDEVVVTATRLPTPAKELPVPVQVISGKDIRQSRAEDLSELLTEYLPGHFQTYPGALSSVSIRGFSTSTTGLEIKGRVLILIDGHPAGTGNAAEIPMENVERVEIMRGPGSVVYGSAAMGGVINIITRKGSGHPSGNAGTEFGSWKYTKGNAGISGGLVDNRLGFSLTGRTIMQGSYETGGGTRAPNTAYNDQAYSASLFAAPGTNHTFFAVGNFYQARDVGTPNPTYMPLDLKDNKDISRWYGSLDYDGSSPDLGIDWHLSYYNVSDQSRWNYPEATYGYTSSTTEQRTQGTQSQLTLPTLSFGRLLVGFDWRRIDVGSNTNPAGFQFTPDTHYDNYAVFAEQKIDLNKLTLLFGTRYDSFQEEILPTGSLDVRRQSQQFGHMSWRGGVTYRLLDWLSGRAAVGTAFSVPSADQLAGSFQSGDFMKVIGNPDLKPETGVTYEGGVDAELAGFKPSITFFYTDYSNKITGGFPACVDGDCSWTTYENVKGAVLSGFEGSLTYKKSFNLYGMPVSLKPFINFTCHTQRELEDKSYAAVLESKVVPYVPLWAATGGVAVGFEPKVTLLLTGFYTGKEEQQNFDFNSPTYGEALDRGGFAVFSAKISFRPVEFLELLLALDNLTDRNYAFVDGYPMPGRSIRGGVQYRF
jgi:vitamin B12 transporter